MSQNLEHVEFEVWGKVQKVYFRKHAKIMAIRLELNGWVKNTTAGSVIGVI